ncbi:unnamed protein product [Schistocephalus solidus]|uniref:C2H2-type domain-containing protein n=1 Tax=Schistocephalus solidus TaxID=70667 RepID=A0A183SPT9_SCHSO|nr:unnamed protein product [Schistocephalus solidus]
MLLWSLLAGIQVSPVAPQSWVFPSGHTLLNRHDRRAKTGEGLRCCVGIYTRSDSRTSHHLPLSQKSYGERDSNPLATRVNPVNAQALPTSPRCQHKLRARIGLVGHLRIECNNNPTTSASAIPAPDHATTITPTTDNNFINAPPPTITDTILLPPPPAPIMATNTTCPTPATSTATSDNLPPVTANTTTTADASDGYSVLTCPHCDRTFTLHIGLVSHLRIHCTENGELVPGAPAHSRDRRLYYPHCPRAITYGMDLSGHMRIHESGIHRDANKSNTSYAPINTSITTTSTSSRAPRISTYRHILPSLSRHMLITHRPDRSPVNPSHRDWRTSTRNTNIHPPHPIQLSALPTHIHTPPGPTNLDKSS